MTSSTPTGNILANTGRLATSKDIYPYEYIDLLDIFNDTGTSLPSISSFHINLTETHFTQDE